MLIVKHSVVIAAIRSIMKGHQIKVWNDKRKNHRRIKIGVCCPKGLAKVRAALQYLGITYEERGATTCMALSSRKEHTPYVLECVSFCATHGGFVESRRSTFKSFARAA
jgi:hypothetical protein